MWTFWMKSNFICGASQWETELNSRELLILHFIILVFTTVENCLYKARWLNQRDVILNPANHHDTLIEPPAVYLITYANEVLIY